MAGRLLRWASTCPSPCLRNRPGLHPPSGRIKGMSPDFEPCPDKPCDLCTGDSAEVTGRDEFGEPVHLPSWEWCQRMNVCAATIDWDAVAGR